MHSGPPPSPRPQPGHRTPGGNAPLGAAGRCRRCPRPARPPPSTLGKHRPAGAPSEPRRRRGRSRPPPRPSVPYAARQGE
ncbi:hypothetical protein B8X03_09220 [Micrococcus luteus]|nr:hypothetical protein B8X03_09220 [Micrococcus luteus]